MRPSRIGASNSPTASGDGIHPAARKLLAALAQYAPARFTWGQAATLAGLKPSGGHFNSGRKDLRAAGYVVEANGLVAPTPDGLKAAGEVLPAPSTAADRLALWCGRLPAPAPEMLRALVAQGERYIDPKPGKPEPYRIRCSPETPGAGGEVEAAADGPLSRAPFRRALVLCVLAGT